MTEFNHRRKNKKAKNVRFSQKSYNNGYGAIIEDDGSTLETPGELDKSLHGWARKSEFADKVIGAGIGNSFCNGNRGMAKSVKGAKKFVRSRIRFHEKQALHKIKSDM